MYILRNKNIKVKKQNLKKKKKFFLVKIKNGQKIKIFK
jgi:hypothetical protein